MTAVVESTSDLFIIDDAPWQEVLTVGMPHHETTGVSDSSTVTADKGTEMTVENNEKNVSCKVDEECRNSD